MDGPLLGTVLTLGLDVVLGAGAAEGEVQLPIGGLRKDRNQKSGRRENAALDQSKVAVDWPKVLPDDDRMPDQIFTIFLDIGVL